MTRGTSTLILSRKARTLAVALTAASVRRSSRRCSLPLFVASGQFSYNLSMASHRKYRAYGTQRCILIVGRIDLTADALYAALTRCLVYDEDDKVDSLSYRTSMVHALRAFRSVVMNIN